MSLLRDIQGAAVDPSTDVATVLRKCKVLASRLGNPDFKQWVDSELNGYAGVDELPAYRILSVQSLGHFMGAFGREVRNFPIPPMCIDEAFREGISKSYLRAPIASYVSLIESGGDSNLQENWPADLVAFESSKILQDMQLVDAWKLIPRSSLVALVDTVRNRILSFVLEVEEEAPDAGEAAPGERPMSQERVAQVFNTYITGDVQNIAAGSSNFSQAADSSIRVGDFGSLAELLRANGVEDADIADLRAAIDDDAKTDEPFGTRVREWMASMSAKAASGAWSVGLSVGGTLLSTALAQYFGLG